MKKIISFTLVLLFVAAVFSLIGWKLADNKKKIENTAAKAQVRNTTVMVSTILLKRFEVRRDFRSSGSFRAFREVAIVSEAPGRVISVEFENGKTVKEGDVLVSLDSDLLTNQIAQLKSNLEKGKRDFQRLSNLLPAGGVSQQQVDDAANALENYRFQLVNLEKQWSLTRIKAPISGTVTHKMVEKGAYITPPMKLGDIVQTGKLVFQTYLTAEQLTFVRTGMQADLSADIMPERKLSGRISLIDVLADPSRRYLVEFLLTNPGSLRPGMSGQVSFNNLATAQVWSIPRSCLVGSSKNAMVYVVKEGKAILRPVQVGESHGQFVSVLGGLDPDEMVVLTGQINLADGVPVVIKN